MGITKFMTVINKYEKIKFKSKLDNVSSLFIDSNGIFHEAKGHIYKTAQDKYKRDIYTDKDRERIKNQDPKELEKKHIKYVVDKFDSILKKFRPSGTLILAPDGMAPAAKMQQQKERRYSKMPEGEVFLGGTISPGTDFMTRLDTAIRKWLSKDDGLFPEKVIYSSHLCPGEGEHKIFDFIRNRDLNNSKGNHVIYGADGDLFIISFFSPLRNIYLFQEVREEYYNIEKLKQEITKDLSYKPLTKSIDPQVLRDFCFLTFLIGNDFIHRLPNLYDTKLSMDILMELYKKNGKDLTNFKHEIKWKNFLSLLKLLRDYKIGGMNMYEFSAYSSFSGGFHNKDWLTYPEIKNAITLKTIRGEEAGDVNYDPKIHTLNFDIRKFAKGWYEKQFKPKTEVMVKLYDGDKFFTRNDVANMCKFYCKILQWALYYYNMGDKRISKFLFYPFFYTPLLESLISYLDSEKSLDEPSFVKGILTNSDYGLTVIHQLMLILPPSNKMLIPSPFRELYVSKLASISPTNYISIPQEGIDVNYKNTKIIPPVNPFLVKKVINMSGEKIPVEYQSVSPLIIIKKQKVIKKGVGYSVTQKELI